ncbi:MAG: DUF4922 domain-containing protein [Bacteroidaceae bacterium]|nr:DUF4922 domain-containing protein [Bacteroidaceae bacterium]
MAEILETFFASQMRDWALARDNHKALDSVWSRELISEKLPTALRVQYNPARMVSTGASIDKASIIARPCFLCADNRPAEQQTLALNEEFEWLVNPYPILPNHYTIASTTHRQQNIAEAYDAMIQAALALPEGYIVFYNGPKCGASAPDHLHLQAGIGKDIPMVEYAKSVQAAEDMPCQAIAPFGYMAYLIRDAEVSKTFGRLYAMLPIPEGEYEPRMNVVAYRNGEHVSLIVIPRHAHRPRCYAAEDEAQYLISPGAIDMCGLIITPRHEDYERLTTARALDILCEVGVRTEPTIDVGIMLGKEITFTLNGKYTVGQNSRQGTFTARITDKGISLETGIYDTLFIEPAQDNATFSLHGVTIGKEFHWQQQEMQTFQGSLILRIIDGELHAINRIAIEDYLTSVIASEMSGTSSVELLKAHAIISRSWLLAQLERDERLKMKDKRPSEEDNFQLSTFNFQLVRWYDREAHTHFDVCADDHCQRYQGVSRKVTPQVVEAIRATRGIVLSYDGEVCDSRFSKCCGGKTELYESCWDDTPHPYLSVVDDPFCNTHDEKVLSEVLNHYDQSTSFYRWTVEYSQEELSELVRRRGGFDYGDIMDLIPIERGPSGRIVRLQIVGTKATRIIGKELEIRRTLSESHLYSSAFDVEKRDGHFVLHGAGWGHGVGLCQIGAAVMGSQGYSHEEILHHYYPEAELTEWYE